MNIGSMLCNGVNFLLSIVLQTCKKIIASQITHGSFYAILKQLV